MLGGLHMGWLPSGIVLCCGCLIVFASLCKTAGGTNSSCREGHEGTLCGSCEEGYTMVGTTCRGTFLPVWSPCGIVRCCVTLALLFALLRVAGFCVGVVFVLVLPMCVFVFR